MSMSEMKRNHTFGHFEERLKDVIEYETQKKYGQIFSGGTYGKWIKLFREQVLDDVANKLRKGIPLATNWDFESGSELSEEMLLIKNGLIGDEMQK
jgi:hypothetical protein